MRRLLLVSASCLVLGGTGARAETTYEILEGTLTPAETGTTQALTGAFDASLFASGSTATPGRTPLRVDDFAMQAGDRRKSGGDAPCSGWLTNRCWSARSFCPAFPHDAKAGHCGGPVSPHFSPGCGKAILGTEVMNRVNIVNKTVRFCALPIPVKMLARVTRIQAAAPVSL